MPSRFLYEQYGNNEPYTDPSTGLFWDPRDPETFIQVITGPSTNIYVGPEEVHYTIPKRLFYRFSDFAKRCLEGSFSEAHVNAIRLPDVQPEVFGWLCQWMYTGRLDVESSYNWCEKKDNCQRACEVLCQVHMLGERLLFDQIFLNDVQAKLDSFIDMTKACGQPPPFTADIIHHVISDSAPAQRDGGWGSSWENPSLRPYLASNLCNFEFCTSFDFLDLGESFSLDGEFAAQLMIYLAGELKWAVELWGAQTESVVNIAEKKLKEAREQGNFQTATKRPKGLEGAWLALKYACTYSGCTTTDFRSYSRCFELDGMFAATILDFMARELKWVIENWGQERGPKVDVAQEKEDERWNDEDYDDVLRAYYRNLYR